MHIVLAGGGTAGHIEPALAVGDALRRTAPGIGITALGTERGLERTLVPARGYELALIPPVPLPRSPTPALASVPARLAGAVRATERVLTDCSASALAGFGGYVAMPAYLAARRLGVPILVHEANARPGLANRVAARLTSHVAVASPDIRLRHAQYVGMPLRSAISHLDRAGRRPEARVLFGLDADRPTLLVFGGSQGARRVNDAAVAAARQLSAAGVQVLHAAGRDHAAGVQAALPAGLPAPYVVVPYLDRMDLAYAAADLALCRSGAMTVAELAAVGLPAAYVPLPIGNGEQRLNAEPVVASGGGMMVADAQLDERWIVTELLPVLGSPDRLTRMGAAAAGHGRRDADLQLAQWLLRLAEGTR